MCSWRRRKVSSKPHDGSVSFSSDSDDENCGRSKRVVCPTRCNFVDAWFNRMQCGTQDLTGKNCMCFILYILFACFLLGFLYFYALTIIYQISKLLRILGHFILPASWLKSTKDIVQEALAKYSADKLGLADYALESVGGSVLCSSETYFAKYGAMYSIFGIPLWYHSSSPREIIQPDVQPGKCWAMDGTHGYVMIQLAMPIIVSAISLEHIPKEVAPSGRLDSAPRDFMIIGKERTMDSPDVVLGRFTYHIGREPIQVYEIKDPYCIMKADGSNCVPNNKVFYIITLKILNNQGNEDFTCIYRLRVHGQPLAMIPSD